MAPDAVLSLPTAGATISVSYEPGFTVENRKGTEVEQPLNQAKAEEFGGRALDILNKGALAVMR